MLLRVSVEVRTRYFLGQADLSSVGDG